MSARQDAVTRAEADRKRIEGLMIQVQDMRAEIDSLKREERATHDTLKPLVERVTSERDALRAEVAALQCIRPKFKVGDKLESDNRSLGLAIPELLPEPVPCVSADAAWLAMDLTVTEYVRRIGAGG